MIFIDGQLCYSPEPPEAYTRGGQGHGLFVKGDIPMWNMVWLSFPKLDHYVNDKCGLIDILGVISPEHFGYVMTAASEELEGSLPGLRQALTKPPDKFHAFSGTFPWESVVAYRELGEAWVTTMRRRAQQAMTLQRKVHCDVSNILKNVISVDFRRGKRHR